MMLVWPDFHMAGTTLCLKISDVTLHKIKIYHHIDNPDMNKLQFHLMLDEFF